MRIWSANDHTFVFALVPIETGRGEDEFLSWEQLAPDITSKAGSDGEVTICENKDKRTKLVLTLMQSSKGNDTLSAIRLASTKLGIASAVAPLAVKDLNGTTTIVSVEAYILGPPKQARKKEVDVLQWEFELANPERFDGGN